MRGTGVLAVSPVAWGLVAALAVLLAAGLGWYWAVTRGRLTLDVGWGRSIRPLGPITVRIDAPRDVVYQQIASPYVGRTPSSLRSKLDVLERSDAMVVAAHHTRVRRFTSTTIEAVTFEPPQRVGFRLLRGPVPHVVEEFRLRDVEGGTELAYTGELGTDFWFLGRIYGAQVARVWERTVAASVEGIKAGAEERAAARAGRSSGEGET